MAAVPASLTGTTVTSTFYYPTTGDNHGTTASTIGAGEEIACPGVFGICNSGLLSTYCADYGARTIALDQVIRFSSVYTDDPFNGWVFSGLTFGAGIASLGLTSFGIAGLDLSHFSFTGNSITLNLAGLAIDSHNGWSVTFTPATVPASGALLLTGLGGLALIRRRV